MSSNRRRLLRLLICLLAPIALYAQTAVHGGCGEIPRQDALPFLCAPATSEILAQEEPDSVILLNLPRGTTLRVAVDEKVRIAKPGQAVSATVTEPVYAFDQTVIRRQRGHRTRHGHRCSACEEKSLVVRKRQFFAVSRI